MDIVLELFNISNSFSHVHTLFVQWLILVLPYRNKLCFTRKLNHVKWRNSEKGFTSRYTTGNYL